MFGEARSKQKIFPVAALALLLGCTTSAYWVKQGATDDDFRRDSYECERDVRQSGYYGQGLVAIQNAQSFYDRCMEARGWTKSRRPYSNPNYVASNRSHDEPLPTPTISVEERAMQKAVADAINRCHDAPTGLDNCMRETGYRWAGTEWIPISSE